MPAQPRGAGGRAGHGVDCWDFARSDDTLRRARGEPEIGPDGKIIEPDDGKTAAKPGKTTAAAKSSKKG